MKRIACLLGLLIANATMPLTSIAASRVFYDSFEIGDAAQWQADDYRDRCIVVGSALDRVAGAKSGAKMLRCNWNGLVAWNDPKRFEALKISGWTFSKEFLVRFWIRRDNDSTDHPASGAKIFRIGQNMGSYGALNFRTGQPLLAMYSDAGQIGSTYWGGGSVLGNGTWHRVDLYVRNGTTDGIIRFWEDGKKTWEAVGVNTYQANWASFNISSNWSGADGCCDHDAANHLYWDDFEIYSDVGSGATGRLDDATVDVAAMPQAPSDVSVN